MNRNQGCKGRHTLWAIGWRGWLLTASVGLCLAQGPPARAQLAVTEAMSWGSTNCVGGRATNNADFFELTNFGTNRLDLTGYRFADLGKDYANAVRLDGLSIDPLEVMIFVRTNQGTVDAAAFRVWWGEANLPANLQIRFYPSNYGFDDQGDAVLLWDAQTNLVDQAVFGEATRGVTFTFDACGQSDAKSQLGVCGAFRAVECEDIGSPGFAPCGPIPLSFAQPPISQTADGGSDVTFSARACGLPRPGYQWYFNGTAISSVKTVASPFPLVVNYAGCGLAWSTNPEPSDLFIPNVQPSHAGQYYVVVTNGLECLTSAVVTLTVNTTPTPPRIECPLPELFFPFVDGRPQTNLVVAPLQTAYFGVVVRGYPPPTIRWSWSADGTSFRDLPLATNRLLSVTFANAGDAGIYRVRVQNSKGTNYAYARLTVKELPRLKITEAMSQAIGRGFNDWWELTNVGDEPVDLYGYRWDDEPSIIGGGPTINRQVIIQPGESVIFMENMTPETFIRWWGASNLPPNLQFIVYTANGLNALKDEITVWNPTATDDIYDLIDSVLFSTSPLGASFWFDTNVCWSTDCPECGKPSIEGQCGAFRAAESGDVGSPGWTAWTPPRLTSVKREGTAVTLQWKAQPGSTNRLEYTDSPSTPTGNESTTCRVTYTTHLLGASHQSPWTELGNYTFTGHTGTATDTTIGCASQRFYRAEMVGCGCVEAPGAISLTREGSAVTLRWRAAPVRTDAWMDLGLYSFNGGTGTATDRLPNEAVQRCYRVVNIAPAICPCEDPP